ncbi:Protein kinase 4 (Fragment) [Seminavis robusta]|uniref:cGMP-dependent protein kinase n=1 Tax=Seminavis robusta TaxID=568900 RepID=A0A9N8EC99_9STRA
MKGILRKKGGKSKASSKPSLKQSPRPSTPQGSDAGKRREGLKRTKGSKGKISPQDGETNTAPASERNVRAPKQNRQNIFAQSLDIEAETNFETPVFPKSATAIQFIDGIMEDNFVFASLAPKERRTMIDAMKCETVPAKTQIIKQGETGDYFYVVEQGTVNFEVDSVNVGSCSRGGAFGELALLYDSPRAATCLAHTECELWKVDQKTFRYILANSTNSQKKDVHHILQKVPFLTDLDKLDLIKLSDAFVAKSYPEGGRIINKGDVGENFYIIQEGTAKVHDIGFGDSASIEISLKAGDYFGERALLTGDPRAAHVTATSTCICLCLSRETFQQVLGPLQGAIDRAMKKRALMGVPVFADSKLQQFEMARLTELIVETTFQPGTVLAEKGKPLIQNLYVILHGKVAVVNQDGMVKILKDADYFGDRYLKEPDGCLSNQSITVKQATKCVVLSKHDIEGVLGNIARLGEPLTNVSATMDRSIRFKDLEKTRILGVGTFGIVWLVNHKKTSKPYALKQLDKREIMGHHQIDGVLREKNIMASLDHPFVIDLVSTFQDECHLYMLIDLVQGGELFSVIHSEKRDGIPNGNARFYAACILEAMSHLHCRNICYRDLKPENVLIDQWGYTVLVDLGFAKVVVDKTYTLCGTPEYLAPEIIVSKGHDKGVDYWAYGALIFEMIVGVSPFYSEGTDQVSLFKRIVQASFEFPEGIVHEQAEDLIKRLLTHRQADRLGCMASGEDDIRNHKWFSVINVDKLLRKQFPVPWKPKIKNALDASHFENYQDLENELPPKTKPLTTAEQVAFKDF